MGDDDGLGFEGFLGRRVGFLYWGFLLRDLLDFGEWRWFDRRWRWLRCCSDFFLLFPHHHYALVGTHPLGLLVGRFLRDFPFLMWLKTDAFVVVAVFLDSGNMRDLGLALRGLLLLSFW